MLRTRKIKILTSRSLLLMAFFFLYALGFGQVHDRSWQELVHNGNAAWYQGKEALMAAENVLLYQKNTGGWPKNIAYHLPLSTSDKKRLEKKKTESMGGSIDNGATTTEMLFLSKLYVYHKDDRYSEAFLKGLDYLLQSQYKNGGWPQFYPLIKGYYSHITYNDNAIVNVMSLLHNIIAKKEYYSISVSEELRKRCTIAFNRGIDCILNTQYLQNGKLTGWCAQYDTIKLQPAKARAYELPSLSGGESAGIVDLLMKVEDPSERLVRAVTKAMEWFDTTKLTGFKVETYTDVHGLKEKRIVKDDNAPPLWARFMDLDSNEPFFCDRDGVKRASLMDIGQERRVGYKWYVEAPASILEKYPEWKKKYDAFDYIVAMDGSGDFTTIQEAIDASKAFPSKRVRILIKKGTYNEKVRVPEWNTKLTLQGEDKDQTIIIYNDFFDSIDRGRNSTFFTPTLSVEADDFIARNLTIKNNAGDIGQAIALSLGGNRCYFENCSLNGNQDTVYLTGENHKQYFKDCYISGTTDFIFGNATAYFENCVIMGKSNSYITAASTSEGIDYGFVFSNCKIMSSSEVTQIYLGRPWRPYARTIFLNCELDLLLAEQGWQEWSNKGFETRTYYAEYNNTGKGYQPDKRVYWAHILNADEAALYSREKVLRDKINPLRTYWYEGL